EACLDGVGHQVRLRLAGGLVDSHLLLHALEGANGRAVPDGDLRVARLSERPRAAVLGEEHVAPRVRLSKLLFELAECRLQGRDLRALILDLLFEAARRSLGALVSLECGAR